MGVRDRAIEAYESLYLQTNELPILYQISVLQLELERLNECNTNLDIIIKNPQSKALKLNFAKNEREQRLKEKMEREKAEKATKRELYNKLSSKLQDAFTSVGIR